MRSEPWGAEATSANTENREDIGDLCPACAEVLWRRNPERMPTIEEYEGIGYRDLESMFASTDEVLRLGRVGDPSVEGAYDAGCI